MSLPRHGCRLALVIHAIYGGGAERLMSELASRWAGAGHDVHLITLARVDTDKYPIAPGVTRHGLDLMRPSRGLLDGLRANRQRIAALRDTIANVQPEFVLSFCDRMNIVTAAATQSLRVPVWLAEHSDPEQQRLGLLWELARSRAYRRLSRRPECGCVVLNSSIAQGMHKRFPKLNLQIIPPAIAIPDAAIEHEQVAADSKHIVLTLGRHSREKNLSVMLDAWKQVADQFPDWRLIMAGDGPEHASLRQQAQRLGISSSVQFPGWISDPWPWLAKADLFALTSLYEGLPVSLLEAMASGTACLSTAVFGDAERFFQAGAVERIDSPQAGAVANSLRKLMLSEERRSQLATAGQQLSRDYLWSAIGAKWDELLSNNRNPKRKRGQSQPEA